MSAYCNTFFMIKSKYCDRIVPLWDREKKKKELTIYWLAVKELSLYAYKMIRWILSITEIGRNI